MRVTRQIPRAEWQSYFDRFTREHLAADEGAVHRAATVELLSQSLGDQYEATVVRLMGLAYDPKSNAFEVLLEDVDHLAFAPSQIWVIEEDDGFVSTLELVSPD